MAAVGRVGIVTVTRDERGREMQQDGFACAHCNRVKMVPHGEQPSAVGTVCRLCYAMICPRPACNAKCDPFEKKLKRIEASDASRRSMGMR